MNIGLEDEGVEYIKHEPIYWWLDIYLVGNI